MIPTAPPGKVIDHPNARRHRRPVTTISRGPLSQSTLEVPIPEEHLLVLSMMQPEEADEFRACLDRAEFLFDTARNRLFPPLQQEEEEQPEPDNTDPDVDDENEHDQTGPRENPDATPVGASDQETLENPDGAEAAGGETGTPGQKDGADGVTQQPEPEQPTEIVDEDEEEDEEEIEEEKEQLEGDDPDDAISAALAAALAADTEIEQ